MSSFIVTITHPGDDAWNKHRVVHVHYLQKLVEDGILRASGPLKGLPRRFGFLIMLVASRQEVKAIVSRDPFALEGLIESLQFLSGILCLELLPQNLAERQRLYWRKPCPEASIKLES